MSWLFYLQVEWKPESPDRFDEISELLRSVESLKLEEGKSQGLSLLFLESETCADCKKVYLVLKRFYSFLGQGSSQKKLVASIPTIQRPAAYRPPHAKQAAAIQAEVLLLIMNFSMVSQLQSWFWYLVYLNRLFKVVLALTIPHYYRFWLNIRLHISMHLIVSWFVNCSCLE